MCCTDLAGVAANESVCHRLLNKLPEKLSSQENSCSYTTAELHGTHSVTHISSTTHLKPHAVCLHTRSESSYRNCTRHEVICPTLTTYTRPQLS